MATCLCDAFYAEVAKASVEVLEHLGCEIIFPEDQTCCGQPAFNAGDWDSSRKVVRHTVGVFSENLPVIIPSGSCAAMMFHGAPLEFEKEEDLDQVNELGSRSWEIIDFIVNGLGITSWPGTYPHKVAFHRSCHSRGTNSGAAAETLLNSIKDIEIVTFGEAEQCCGFGGAFSVSFPNISKSMGELKLNNICASKPDTLCSADGGCLLHLGGIAEKEKIDLPRTHIILILREALANAGLL